MKIDVRTTKEVVCGASILVEETDRGGVCLLIKFNDGRTKRCFLDPASSVMLWRVFSGTAPSAMVEYRTVPDMNACPEKILVAQDAITHSRRVEVGTKDVFCLNSDESLAIAWSIKECVTRVLRPVNAGTKEISLAKVWILTSRRVLTGDCAADGPDLIGGTTEVFSSKKKAEDRLREFMRPLVNEAHPDGSIDESEFDVDEVLDNIIDCGAIKSEGIGSTSEEYSYEGSTQSFVVELTEKFVDEA